MDGGLSQEKFIIIIVVNVILLLLNNDYKNAYIFHVKMDNVSVKSNILFK